jgi:hypothetical protein
MTIIIRKKIKSWKEGRQSPANSTGTMKQKIHVATTCCEKINGLLATFIKEQQENQD